MLAEIKTWVCQRGTVREASNIYLASLLVHESVHGEFFEKCSKNINSCEEPKAYKTQIEFLKKHKDLYGTSYVTELLKERHCEYNEFVKKDEYFNFFNSVSSKNTFCRQCKWFPLCTGGCSRYFLNEKFETRKNDMCESRKIIFEHIKRELKKKAYI